MLFLVSGASGAGKSTVRELLAPCLDTDFEAVELRDLGPTENVTVQWRQQMAEVAATRAATIAPSGRHLLLSGDPVTAGEVIAAPSATDTGGIAVCILDITPEAQTHRLTQRGDPQELLPLHLTFAQWMREHAVDPLSRSEAITDQGAPGMRWDRLDAAHADRSLWRTHLIDTSTRTPHEVAALVNEWIHDALTNGALVMRPETWPTTRPPAMRSWKETRDNRW